jgi:Bacteriophage tail sheath protein
VPEYLAPGVYIEEVSFRAKSIEGVSTSTTGFIGSVRWGRTGEAIRIRSFADYENTFGALDPHLDLGYAVQQFFINGGASAWVVGLPEGSSPAQRLSALDSVPQLALLCLPGEADPTVLTAALRYVERRRAFLIVDPPGPDPSAAAELVRQLARTGGANGALYFPRLRLADPLESGKERLCPPSGSVAGIYARTDVSRGVFKAPAGTEAIVLGVQDVEMQLDHDEASRLEAGGVNSIRTFPGRGPRVWGARTLMGANGTDPEYKYVPVRRAALFIEKSLYRGTQWVAFEPNEEPLWAQLRLATSAFLDRLFRAGAFQGRTSQDAYFVRCDRSTMTQVDLDNGLVRIEVGFAALKPAEFVIVDIERLTARVAIEQVGPATGETGLVISLTHRQVSREGFSLQVEGPHGWTRWALVPEFEGFGSDESVYRLDEASGQITFGDGVHGAVPSKGAGIQATYKYGSGPGGNPRA